MKEIFLIVLVLIILSGCSDNKAKKFRLVPSSESGITFRNRLHETVEFNIFNYMYFYNGAGVAVGDVNGDGLLDIYFTANQEPNKLYLNKGDLKFSDITEIAGVAGYKGWATGVTMADVNNDGRLDLYVCYLGDYLIFKGRNQLFINEGNDENGIPTFSEKAIDYGLDLVGFSTQATFFDYDRDGDLDMFMLNHSLHQNGTFAKSTLRETQHPLAGDKLLRNDNGRFVDVTSGSGIYSSALGYGLGVVVSDVNLDGWPDIYVGNDFHENDYLYINQRDGTFKEQVEEQMQHTSRYSMGLDYADFNNDAFPDLVEMDMLPEDQQILKASAAEDPFDVYEFKLNYGYNHQFSRNSLQINNQNGTYSEIGLLAGVAATDWSWSTLMADFDLDGMKDIFVSNGIYRRSNDLDYINFVTVDSIQMKLEFDLGEKELQYVKKMPQIKIPNCLFRNNGDSTFSNMAIAWGLDKPSYSHGSAYADLDNDGDLDLVINNVEDEAFLYENKTRQKGERKDSVNHFLQVSLKGAPGNRFGIGTKVFLYEKGKMQMQECIPTRGFQSAVDYRLLFGAGRDSVVDSLVAVWPDGAFQKLTNVNTDQHISLEQKDAAGKFDYSVFHLHAPLFVDVTADVSIPYKHKENKFVEFNREGLIPHMLSAEGPAVAVGDVNGDGLEDIFLGGAKWQAGQLFVQTITGKFMPAKQPALAQDSTYEDVDATLFDADGDKDLDLLVVSGGDEYAGKSPFCDTRFYLNDGKGLFTRTVFPDVSNTGSCVSVCDFDQDGDLDVFIGSRSIPWRYGIKPDSYFFRNEGGGKFSDVTNEVAPMLKNFGFVTNAAWCDMNGDGRDDLVIAAEWSPITILINDGNKLHQLLLPGSGLEHSNGWWNVVKPFDLDGDGDMDLIAGNLGENSKLKASLKEPIRMYVSDFDKNDSTDQVLTYYVHGVEYPFYTRDEMTKQMPYLKKRYLSYKKFAKDNFHQMFSGESLSHAEQFNAYILSSVWIENLGNGKFAIHSLPKAAQISTVKSVMVDDFDRDGKFDMLLAGNFYPVNIQCGRYDASYGELLVNEGSGKLKAVPSVSSGFSVKGEVRNLKKLRVGDRTVYLAVRNDDTVEAFALKP